MNQPFNQKVLEFSERLNKAQKPIRILNAIKWDEKIIKEILDSGLKSIPNVDADYYLKNDLGFDPIKKILEIEEIRMDLDKSILADTALGKILWRNCHQYELVVRMLLGRGTKEFYLHSKKLFGSTHDTFADGVSKISDLGPLLNEILQGLKTAELGESYQKNLSDTEMVEELRKRLRPYFHGTKINIKLDDGILSDAAAGSDYIKIKTGAKFGKKDIDIFEVHEGQVHLGTTINGKEQTFAKWLSKGPPCTTVVQEGLAVMMEILHFATFPARAKRINDRLIACQLAEEGADLKKVLGFYKDMGLNDEDALGNALRVFRGGVISGGAPFTKDISYCTGFIMVYNFVRTAIRMGMPEFLPFLFAGKVTLEDVPVLYEYHKRGTIDFPKYLPLKFSDLNGLSVWMAFSAFLNKMNLEAIGKKFKDNLVA